ncbi:cupredoxin domain-containing protein [Natronorarus salvus]|uniref:cupredoxin domain-containing protein n=1 Tax=Natronorarus salvus TaxID=3117733 RepID=UPI002F261260
MTGRQTRRFGRRSFTITLGSALAVGLAGCADNSDGPDADGDDGNEPEDDDAGNDDAGDADGYEIAGGTDIVLDGYSTHWEGVEPGEIEGEENPTLVLEAGEEYTIEWINADDVLHDLQIWDDGGDVVDDLVSDEVDTEGESATLEFEASEGMANYVCNYHQAQQIGDLVVE